MVEHRCAYCVYFDPELPINHVLAEEAEALRRFGPEVRIGGPCILPGTPYRYGTNSKASCSSWEERDNLSREPFLE